MKLILHLTKEPGCYHRISSEEYMISKLRDDIRIRSRAFRQEYDGETILALPSVRYLEKEAAL